MNKDCRIQKIQIQHCISCISSASNFLSMVSYLIINSISFFKLGESDKITKFDIGTCQIVILNMQLKKSYKLKKWYAYFIPIIVDKLVIEKRDWSKLYGALRHKNLSETKTTTTRVFYSIYLIKKQSIYVEIFVIKIF